MTWILLILGGGGSAGFEGGGEGVKFQDHRIGARMVIHGSLGVGMARRGAVCPADWRCQLSEHLSLKAESITATHTSCWPGEGLLVGGRGCCLQTGGGADGCSHFRQTRSPFADKA